MLQFSLRTHQRRFSSFLYQSFQLNLAQPVCFASHQNLTEFWLAIFPTKDLTQTSYGKCKFLLYFILFVLNLNLSRFSPYLTAYVISYDSLLLLLISSERFFQLLTAYNI